MPSKVFPYLRHACLRSSHTELMVPLCRFPSVNPNALPEPAGGRTSNLWSYTLQTAWYKSLVMSRDFHESLLAIAWLFLPLSSPSLPPRPIPNIFSKTANSRLLLGRHGVIHVFEVTVQLWGTDLRYLDPRRFSVSELRAHNH